MCMIHPICSAYIHTTNVYIFFRKEGKHAYFTFLLNYFLRRYVLELWDGCDWNLPAFVSNLSTAWRPGQNLTFQIWDHLGAADFY